MTETIDQFKALLAEFKELPSTPQRAPTTLELSGYPHLENVYSNILAFFLDPGCEHGFRSLFLASLLSVAEYEAIQDGEKVEVNREEVTGTRKQIDLVISTDTLIIGIENKIYQPLQNDLEDYGRHLTERANGRRVCKILLGLNSPNDGAELSGFKRITYEAYFNEILRRIGPALIESKDRYLRFLLEVIETVNHLTEDSAMKPEMLAFFENNRKDVELLWKETQNLRNNMRSRVRDLQEILNISNLPRSQDRSVEQWRDWETYELFETLVHDISIESGLILAMETWISPKGWAVDVFTREGDIQRLRPWLETTQERDWEAVDEEGPYRLDLSVDLPYCADPSKVADKLKRLLESAMTYPFS